jgi:hypothetical protein
MLLALPGCPGCSAFGQEVQGLSVNVTGLRPSSNYTWSIRARNTLGDSKPVTGSVTTGGVVPTGGAVTTAVDAPCINGTVPGPVTNLTAKFTPPRGKAWMQSSHSLSAATCLLGTVRLQDNAGLQSIWLHSQPPSGRLDARVLAHETSPYLDLGNAALPLQPAGPIVLVLNPPANRACVTMYRITAQAESPPAPARTFSVAPFFQQRAAFGFWGGPSTTYVFTVVGIGSDGRAGSPSTVKATTGPQAVASAG